MVATHGPDASDGDSGFSDVSVVSPSSVLSASSMVSKESAVSASSSTPSATPSLPGKPKISRTKPNCNKCKNHGVVNPLSGHKRYCQYRDCVCELCLLTEERRRVMAAQTRQKRAQVQDEKNGLPLEMRAPVLPPPTSPAEGGLVPSPQPSPTAHALFPSDLSMPSAKKRKIEEEPLSHVEAARRLVAEFGAADSVLPFALALVKRVGDYKVVSKMILDIQVSLLEKTRLTASLVHDRPPIFAHGPKYVPKAHSNSSPFAMGPYR